MFLYNISSLILCLTSLQITKVQAVCSSNELVSFFEASQSLYLITFYSIFANMLHNSQKQNNSLILFCLLTKSKQEEMAIYPKQIQFNPNNKHL